MPSYSNAAQKQRSTMPSLKRVHSLPKPLKDVAIGTSKPVLAGSVPSFMLARKLPNCWNGSPIIGKHATTRGSVAPSYLRLFDHSICPVPIRKSEKSSKRSPKQVYSGFVAFCRHSCVSDLFRDAWRQSALRFTADGRYRYRPVQRCVGRNRGQYR